jgi:hypothetical protein
MTLQTIEEINAILPAIEVSQPQINGRDHVVEEIKHVLLQVQERMESRQI